MRCASVLITTFAPACRAMWMEVVQIETIRLRIDFEQDAMIAGGLDDFADVDGIRFALADQPPGRMPKNVHATMLQRAHDATGHLDLRHVEP